MLRTSLIAVVLVLAGASAVRAAESSDAAQAAEFFEQKIRPILSAHCWKCHGEKKQEAGLRLDSRAALMAGSEKGSVVEADKSGESRLLHAIHYADDELQMPPDGKLPDAAIAALERWIATGAVWPETSAKSGDAQAAWKKHWAFQPIADPPAPAVKHSGWVQAPLDRFVLARLEQAGLEPSPPADRRVLIRRLSFDLIGLPPTPEEIDAFVADHEPDAMARLVDRLLASPHYGERWARHWLDLARYADNKGYKFFGGDQFYAYTYRDWVIDSLNADMPFDRFVAFQLAADQMVEPDDTRPLAALGFLTVGRRFLEDQHDIIDDRIDVVTRGLLGLTVTCARCHDHKFDPIPSADYYSLYGVFAATRETTRTLIERGKQSDAERAYEQGMHEREAALDAWLAGQQKELVGGFRSRTAEYLLAGQKALALPSTDKFMFVEDPDKLSEMIIGNWRALLERTARGHDPVFAAWHAMAALPEAEFAARAPAVASAIAANVLARNTLTPALSQREREEVNDTHPHNRLVAAMFAGPPPKTLTEVAERYGRLFSETDLLWNEQLAAAPKDAPPSKFEDADREQLRRVLYGPTSPTDVTNPGDVEMLVGRPGQAKITDLRKKINEFYNKSKIHPARAMILEDVPELCQYQPHVFLRGKSVNLGPEVPRQFPAIAAGKQRRTFEHGSGRADLARAIVDPGNPLTARVLVNRIWQHHFGSALVRTPSDFGIRSQPPTHPELLDALASSLVREGWSLKQLHRQIVLSATYQQSSNDRPSASAIDPENRLLWRMNRQRLDLEAFRDALLATSGKLDPAMHGPPVPIAQPPFTPRRTVYGFVDRENLPGFFSTFDFASPDAHSPQRFVTTVPQQALFLMNSPMVQDQARALLERSDVASIAAPAARIDRIYQLLFGRAPDADELALGLAAVSAAPAAGEQLNPWQRYAQALLLTNEFVFID